MENKPDYAYLSKKEFWVWGVARCIRRAGLRGDVANLHLGLLKVDGCRLPAAAVGAGQLADELGGLALGQFGERGLSRSLVDQGC